MDVDACVKSVFLAAETGKGGCRRQKVARGKPMPRTIVTIIADIATKKDTPTRRHADTPDMADDKTT